MAEETIWRGAASQLKNLGCFILCFLFCWLIVPIFIGLRRYLETKNQPATAMFDFLYAEVPADLEAQRELVASLDRKS